MIKYIDEITNIVFEEIPDKVTLAISISNCQNNCIGCHSSFLRKNIGKELDKNIINELISNNKGINCVLFLGEGNDYKSLINLSKYIKDNFKGIETAIYSGRDEVEDDFYKYFDYVKIGHYDEKLGPLSKKTTNQRLYYHNEDITYKFWNLYKNS